MGKRKQKKPSNEEAKNKMQPKASDLNQNKLQSPNGNQQNALKSTKSNDNQENIGNIANYHTPNKRDNGSRNQQSERAEQNQANSSQTKPLNGITQVEVRQKGERAQNLNQGQQNTSYSDEIVLDLYQMQAQLSQQQIYSHQTHPAAQSYNIEVSQRQNAQSFNQKSTQKDREQTAYQMTLNSGGKNMQQQPKPANSSTHQTSNDSHNKNHQCYSDDKNLKTLLHSQKQLVNNYSQNYSQSANSNKMNQTAQGKVLHKNVQNQLQVQVDNSYRSTQQSFNSSSRQGDYSQVSKHQDYLMEEDFDSALDEEEVEYGEEEFVDDEIVQTAFQQQNNIQNQQNQQSNLQNNYYYDEVEATQYSSYNNQGSNHQSNNQYQQQPQQQYISMRNFQTNKASNVPSIGTAIKNMQQISIETLIQGDEQTQSDIKFCLYCIYNNYDIQQYFKQLLRVQKRLKEWSMQLNPQLLFSIFEANIKEFMHGIRDRLIDEMKQLQMIRQKPSTRRYSCDDYFLIDKTFSKSYSHHGYNNEILSHCMKYMLDSKYESIRNDLRHRIWSEMRKNNEIIVSFYQHPDAYQKIFDLLIKFYTRVRDSIMGIEEMWVFFMESVFRQELKGNMIFEQFHKQLFKKDILSHRYVQSFLKEINEAQLDLENRRQRNITNVLDPVIENISQILYDLDEDLNFQYPEEDSQQDNGQNNQITYQDTSNGISVTNEGDEQYEEGLDGSDQDLIITYQQLQDKIKQQYGGLSLAQQVEQYSTQSQDYQKILQQIQNDKRCQELMKSLPNLDTETLYYIINNNLSHKDYEDLINQQVANNKIVRNGNSASCQDDVIISPSKNLNFLNNYLTTQVIDNNQDGEGSNNEDEDEEYKQLKQMEKKKKKNLKKKRKRKEKKIMAQHQIQLEEMLKIKILEEQQRRGVDNEQARSSLKKKLVESLGIDSSDAENYILNLQQSQSKNSKGSHSDSSQNEFQTKKTQCDEEEEAEDPAIQKEFEQDLEKFRQRLEQPQSFQTILKRKNSKLRPNITTEWISSLRERLNSFYQQCESPKNSNSNGKAGAQISDGLWVKSYQRSA